MSWGAGLVVVSVIMSSSGNDTKVYVVAANSIHHDSGAGMEAIR